MNLTVEKSLFSTLCL